MQTLANPKDFYGLLCSQQAFAKVCKLCQCILMSPLSDTDMQLRSVYGVVLLTLSSRRDKALPHAAMLHSHDGMYLRPRCIKIACDALRWVFQHVGIPAPDFGISLLFIVRFSNGLDHCDGHLIGFHLMHSLKFSAKYF